MIRDDVYVRKAVAGDNITQTPPRQMNLLRRTLKNTDPRKTHTADRRKSRRATQTKRKSRGKTAQEN